MEHPLAQDTLKLIARIGCKGSLNAPPDLNVAFYEETGAGRTLLGTVVIERSLQPGEYIDTGIIITDQNLRGEHNVTVVVDDDGTGLSRVREPDETDNEKSELFYFFNHAPEITYTEMPHGYVNQEYSYQVIANDADTHTIKYRLMVGEINYENSHNLHLTIDSLTGIISCKIWPGTFDLRVQVKDEYDAYATQDFTLIIENTENHPPVITSSPVTNAQVDVAYLYQVVADDPDDDPLFYSLKIDNDLQTPPIGMDISPMTGMITWTPGEYFSMRTQTVIVEVSDRRGGDITQEFIINLDKPDNNPPQFLTLPEKNCTQGQEYTYTPQVLDLDGDAVYVKLLAGPPGMALSSGPAVSFIPEQMHVGVQYFLISATDSYDTVFQACTLTVNNVNDQPVIASQPNREVFQNAKYAYTVTAADPDEDVITYSITGGPSAMTISSEGVIAWNQITPAGTQTEVEIRATDPSGAFATQRWVIETVADTVKPSIGLTVLPTLVMTGGTVEMTIQATDNAGISRVGLNVAGIPVTLDAENHFSLQTTVEDTIALTGYAVDINGNSDTLYQEVIVSDDADNTPPVVQIMYTPVNPQAGDNVAVSVTATDSKLDRERVWLLFDGRYVDLDGTGNAIIQASKRGTFSLMATAYDSAGNVGSTTETMTVLYTGTDSDAPVVQIDSPAEDSVIISISDIIGTVNDADLAYYTVSYRAVSENEFVEVYRNTSSVTSGVLGIVDGTVLENGIYTIRITAYDRFGNMTYDETTIRIDGQLKLGNFSIAFSDMKIPLPGFELSAVRTYDSRNRYQGDFGYGWQLDYHSVSLSESHAAGEAWNLVMVNGGLYPQYVLNPTAAHTVSIAIPGGRTQVFDVVPEFFSAYSATYGTIAYRPQTGTYSSLKHLDADEFMVMGGELYDVGGDFQSPFNPDVYQLTLLDGTTYLIDQNKGGVVEIKDADGNAVTMEPQGISHTSGKALAISRDAYGRIISLSDERGRRVDYTYDPHGNLAQVTDPKGNSTRFKYAPDHYLTEIIDARGVRAARTEYDDEGRMVRQISPENDTMTFDHDGANSQEVTTDFNGNSVVYSYDPKGNVTGKVDAGNNRWTYTYDNIDNLVATGNPDGTSRSSTWDDRGNELTSTDELNRTTSRAFNHRGQVETETDALNRRTEYTYDPVTGNLLMVTGPDGTITSEKTYDSHGSVLTEKDALGNLTQYGYDSQGRMTSRTDPLGRTTRYLLDARGNTLGEISYGGDTTKYAYDLNDNQIMAISVGGDTVTTGYNVFNKVSLQKNALGNETTFEYDLFGQLKKTIAPDSSFTQRTYDAQGNVLTTADEANRTTTFEYDHENRVAKTIFTDGSFTNVEYDSRGRRTASIDRNGNRTEYEYDEVGNNTVVRDALGNETTYEYDKVNRRVAMVDALSQRTEYVYDDYDRLVRTTFADATYKETEYDLAGRKTAEVDQEGKRTEFTYDSTGNLRTVKDAMNFVTEYTYDSNNNRITQTDANNHTTTMEYDKVNRLTKRTYPNGDQERFGFDANGNMIHKVSGVDSTAFTYDNRNREVLTWYSNSGHTVETKYTVDSKKDTVIDHRGVTDYDYDSDGRLEVVTNPDKTFIQYAYDSNGNKTEMTTPWGTTQYSFDVLNRMMTVTNETDVTEYFYNAVGNRDSISHANGTSVAYDYDNLNRLTTVTNYAPDVSVISSFTYELNDAGIRTAVTEADGSQVDYGYDDLYRLTGESRTGTNAYSIVYTYDNVGNRLTKDHDGVMTNYVYNNRDQVTSETNASETITYTYDGSGRTETKTDNSGVTTYGWADNDRLVSVALPSGTVTYTYDANGNKVSTNDGTTTKNYLVDMLQPYAQVIAEYDNANNVTAEYVYGLERISQDRGGSVHVFLADGSGSIRELVNGAGIVTDTYKYFAFGELLNRTGSTINEWQYVGEAFDPNIGFYYLRARWMNPETGLFLSVDPHAGDPQAPITLHRYLYAGANPINNIDPSGEFFGGIIGQMKAITIQGILRARTFITLNVIRIGVWAKMIQSISSTRLHSILSKHHVWTRMLQLPYHLSKGRAAAEAFMRQKTYFNPAWGPGQVQAAIIQAMRLASKEGVTQGLYEAKIGAEIIIIELEAGILRGAYGLHSLGLDDVGL